MAVRMSPDRVPGVDADAGAAVVAAPVAAMVTPAAMVAPVAMADLPVRAGRTRGAVRGRATNRWRP